MSFHAAKCKVMILNGGSTQVRFTLDDTVLSIVTTFRYLGVVLTSKYVTNLFKEHFRVALEKARSRASAIRGLGFSKDGFRVKTVVKLYKLQVRPLLEFSAQSLTYSNYSALDKPDAVGCFAKKLEHLQTQLLKILINCPRSTSPAIARLFCGTEPLVGRLEILKARYFWRLLHGPANAICSRILKYRRERFLDCNRGFARDVFNICIKYDIMHIWHGLAPPGGLNRRINPLQYIKRIIISENLRRDLEDGRTRSCCFSKNFLVNPFCYQKSYQIVPPFSSANSFSSANGRRRFIKALLHPCTYLDHCPLCRVQTRDTCEHMLAVCPLIPDPREKLRLELLLYNYPTEYFPLSKSSLIEHSLTNRLWRKCFAEFLANVDF